MWGRHDGTLRTEKVYDFAVVAARGTHVTQRLARFAGAGRFAGLLFCCVFAVDWMILFILKV